MITYDKTVPMHAENKLSNECTNATETPNELSTYIEKDNETPFEHSYATILPTHSEDLLPGDCWKSNRTIKDLSELITIITIVIRTTKALHVIRLITPWIIRILTLQAMMKIGKLLKQALLGLKYQAMIYMRKSYQICHF